MCNKKQPNNSASKNPLTVQYSSFGCDDIESMVGDYLEGSLPSEMAKGIANHITQCETCTNLEREYSDIMLLGRTLRNKPMPAGVSKRLRLNLNRELGISLPV